MRRGNPLFFNTMFTFFIRLCKYEWVWMTYFNLCFCICVVFALNMNELYKHRLTTVVVRNWMNLMTILYNMFTYKYLFLNCFEAWFQQIIRSANASMVMEVILEESNMLMMLVLWMLHNRIQNMILCKVVVGFGGSGVGYGSS